MRRPSLPIVALALGLGFGATSLAYQARLLDEVRKVHASTTALQTTAITQYIAQLRLTAAQVLEASAIPSSGHGGAIPVFDYGAKPDATPAPE